MSRICSRFDLAYSSVLLTLLEIIFMMLCLSFVIFMRAWKSRFSTEECWSVLIGNLELMASVSTAAKDCERLVTTDSTPGISEEGDPAVGGIASIYDGEEHWTCNMEGDGEFLKNGGNVRIKTWNVSKHDEKLKEKRERRTLKCFVDQDLCN